MPRVRLTDALIDKLQVRTERRQEFFDILMPGLALRVSKHGRKSWILFHRVGGQQQRITLGAYPILSIKGARDGARTILQGHPYICVGKSANAPSEPVRLFGDTFDEFIERYAKVNNRSWRQTASLGKRRIIPQWGNKPLADIRKADVVALLDGIVDDGAPVQANLAFAHIRKFFNWCGDRAYIEKSPCDGVRMPTKVQSRDRVLTNDEIRSIWKACDTLGAPFGDYLKVLMLTGQRRAEVAGLAWAEVEGNIWTIPKARTKNGMVHRVPLSPAVIDIMQKQPRDRELVFTTTGVTPISGFSKMKVKLDKAVGFSDWRIHDLRRTCATGMAGLKVAPHVIEKVLNHKTGEIRGVAAVYNRHAYIDECRDALNAWSEFVTASVC